ncbi:hypothetical protein BD779DRAFT_1480917 [Infundibulicybe gibba]|nr:hypothetical protein BD779DRAFT_1480917 [Infundibulicybe gibba]
MVDLIAPHPKKYTANPTRGTSGHWAVTGRVLLVNVEPLLANPWSSSGNKASAAPSTGHSLRRAVSHHSVHEHSARDPFVRGAQFEFVGVPKNHRRNQRPPATVVKKWSVVMILPALPTDSAQWPSAPAPSLISSKRRLAVPFAPIKSVAAILPISAEIWVLQAFEWTPALQPDGFISLPAPAHPPGVGFSRPQRIFARRDALESVYNALKNALIFEQFRGEVARIERF